MAAILMYLKQLICIFLWTNLCLASLAAANPQEMLQPKPHKVWPLNARNARSATSPVLESQPIELAALGRPLFLGMLYDCRKDSFIPGVTLWDKKSLSENLDSRPQPMTDLKFSSSDSLSSKASLLDVSASLKASFLGGLVEVGGSAKFLHDTKSSNQQSRVTMYYSEISRFEQLTMTHLGKFTYPQVFDQKTATHVVTAVQYGAKAVMAFDRTFSEEENKQEIEGELNLMVNKIPLFSIEGNAALKMTDDEKKTAEKIACTFHGDISLKQNPTTYMEALTLFKELPTLVKENQNMVPIKVWLYPLNLLDTRAARMMREISTSIVSSAEDIMERLSEAERTCNDLSKSTLVNAFRDVKERLRSFQSSFKIYKSMLLKAFGRVLPAIREGGMEEKSLEDILRIHKSSPFNVAKLNQWLNDAKSELNLLRSFTNTLTGIKMEDSDRLNSILLDPNIDFVVSLTFTSLQYEDQYLSTLKEFLKSDKFKEIDGANNVPVSPVKKWFNNPDVITKMREDITHFRSFSEVNKNNVRIRFIISTISDPSSLGSSIYLYEKGKLTDTKYQLVSKPLPPVRDAKAQTVALKLNESPTGNTLKYRVEYKELKSGQEGGDEQWISIETTNKDITLTGLPYGKQYTIRSRALDKVGMSEASDTVSPNPSTDRPVLVGGDGGYSTSLITPSISGIRKMKIYYEEESPAVIAKFKAMEVIFNSGQKFSIGSSSNMKAKEFLFDNDRIVSAILWLNKNRNRVCGMDFLVEKSTGERRIFSIRCKDLGDPVKVDVKSGKCYGIAARFANEIDKLGFYFI
ncbi:hypothetical protein QQF64_035901 [Cirrhinus molitorella]|uniref:Fibronectin type-III domain-containing protein n=1 Tax=Cirrhinus molitorella TaxID=172907 RepID=A0ABR3NHV6_9TELE